MRFLSTFYERLWEPASSIRHHQRRKNEFFFLFWGKPTQGRLRRGQQDKTSIKQIRDGINFNPSDLKIMMNNRTGWRQNVTGISTSSAAGGAEIET